MEAAELAATAQTKVTICAAEYGAMVKKQNAILKEVAEEKEEEREGFKCSKVNPQCRRNHMCLRFQETVDFRPALVLVHRNYYSL